MMLKKIISVLIAICCMITPFSALGAALPGEVERIVPYTPYGEASTGNIRLVLPEKYKDYVPVPYASQYEDDYSPWMIYKPVTLDGVFYTWAKIDSFTEAEEKINRQQNVWFEYALIPGANPYTQAGVPETQWINYPSGAKFNRYNLAGASASDMRILIDGRIRSFEKSFYPKLELGGNYVYKYEPFDKIPMVSIREFVESTDNLSLVWDNGTITVTNSDNGAVTRFRIYRDEYAYKAVLIDGTSYASLTDLLKAEFGEAEFNKYRYYNSTKYGQDIIYIKIGDSPIPMEEEVKNFKAHLSQMGILNGYVQLARPNGLLYAHSDDPEAYTFHECFFTKLTAWDELEQVVVPSGCIYHNPIIKFSTTYNDAELWKGKMAEATKNGATDKEKVQLLLNLLKNSFHKHSTYGDGKKASEKAVTEGKFVGSEKDLQKLFLLGCTGNNIPSVKLESNGRGVYGRIVAAYYDGKWNYFDVKNAKEVSKSLFVEPDIDKAQDKTATNYISVSNYSGLGNSAYSENLFDDDGANFYRTWNTRYAAIGYRNGYQ